MASPPTSATSTRVGDLHLKEGSSSFHSLNPFRRKSIPQTAEYREPYEVAPGIWSTDATAKVFGYLDPVERKPSKRSRSAGPDDRQPKPGRVRALIDRIREARRDDETDEFLNHPKRLHVEARERARQSKLEEARQAEGESHRRTRSARMRMVSREDELIERAANPRTGIVSPFVTSEDSPRTSADSDYVAVGKVRAAKASQKQRNISNNGRWRQDSGGWSIVESPGLTPVAQSNSSDKSKSSKKASGKAPQDELLAEMPGVKHFHQKIVMNEEIRRYQESIEQAYRHYGGPHALVDPNTLPSPRQWTPEGPSTPPNRLHKIRRKEVGSGPAPPRRAQSTETVIVNERLKLPSRVPSMSHSARENQQVRIITPSQINLGSFPRTPLDKESTFLGKGPPLSPTASGGPSSPIKRPTGHQSPPSAHRGPPCPKEALFEAPSTSPTLSQYLPRIHFPHPNQVSNLETSGYRRPAQLLPPRLRPLGARRNAVEDACTITTTTTSTAPRQKDSRPRLQRQGGVSDVQRLHRQAMSNSGEGQRLLQRTMQRRQQSPGKSIQGRIAQQTGQESHIPTVHPGNTERSSPRHKDGAQAGARNGMLAGMRIQRVREAQKRSKEALASRSPNVVQGVIPPELGMVGCTPIYVRPSHDVLRAHVGGDLARRPMKEKPYPKKLDGFVDEGGVCFTGYWRDEARGEPDDTSASPSNVGPTLTRRLSLRERVVEVRHLLLTMEQWVHTSLLLAWGRRRLWHLCCHVVSSLLGTPAAIDLLRSSHTKPAAFVKSIRDVVIAAIYLLILANLGMTVGRLVLVVLRALYWICHPFTLVSSVLSWCIFN